MRNIFDRMIFFKYYESTARIRVVLRGLELNGRFWESKSSKDQKMI